MNFPNFITPLDVTDDLPVLYLCRECFRPLLQAMNGQSAHRRCRDCALAAEMRGRSGQEEEEDDTVYPRFKDEEEDVNFSRQVYSKVKAAIVRRGLDLLQDRLKHLHEAFLTRSMESWMDPHTLVLRLKRFAAELIKLPPGYRDPVIDESTNWVECSSLDGPLQLGEPAAVFRLRVSGVQLSNLGQLNTYTNLRELELRGCCSGTSLEICSTPPTLTRLSLESCNVEHVTVEITPGLRVLEFRKCSALTTLTFSGASTSPAPSSPGTYQEPARVRLYGCHKFCTLEGAEYFPHLGEFAAPDSNFADLDALLPCKELKFLDLHKCPGLTWFQPLTQFKMLVSINVSDTKFKHFDALVICKDLEEVRISRCIKIEKDPPLSADAEAHSEKLKEVRIFEAQLTKLNNLETFMSCANLEVLNVNHCSEMKTLCATGEFVRLKSLDASHTAIPSIRSFLPLSSIERANLQDCKELTFDSSDQNSPDADLSGAFKLHTLLLGGTNAGRLPMSRGCPRNLRIVDIRGCRSIKEVRALCTASKLRMVDISNTAVTDLAPLSSSVDSLQVLLMYKCSGVDSISALKSFANLEFVDLRETHVTDIAPLKSSVPVLRVLAVGNRDKHFSGVEDISVLQHAQRLGAVMLMCNKLTSIDALAACMPNLERLWLDKCRNLKDIRVLGQAPKLQFVSLLSTSVKATSMLAGSVLIRRK